MIALAWHGRHCFFRSDTSSDDLGGDFPMSKIQQLFAGIEVILYKVVLEILPIVLLFILLNFLVSVYAENGSGIFLKFF